MVVSRQNVMYCAMQGEISRATLAKFRYFLRKIESRLNYITNFANVSLLISPCMAQYITFCLETTIDPSKTQLMLPKINDDHILRRNQVVNHQYP